jgi:hypothetical protein
MQVLIEAKWIPLDRLSLADLPEYGDVPGCCVLRRAAIGCLRG